MAYFNSNKSLDFWRDELCNSNLTKLYLHKNIKFLDINQTLKKSLDILVGIIIHFKTAIRKKGYHLTALIYVKICACGILKMLTYKNYFS